MGTITVNVSDDIEERFRAEVKEHVGEGKGVLGKAVREAFEGWIHQRRQEDIANALKESLKHPWKGGKLLYKKREELYDRWNRK